MDDKIMFASNLTSGSREKSLTLASARSGESGLLSLRVALT